MTKPILLITAFLISLSLTASPTIRYVDQSAPGANDGTNWTNAYTSLQSAISASVTGDTLWIADGIYKPAASDRTISFLINGLALIGGFAGGETSTSQRNILVNSTILSGDLSGDDTGSTNNGENSYRVVEVSATGNATILDGLTISGANSSNTGSGTNLGGGIKLSDGTGTNLQIKNCIIEYNAVGNGGGLYTYSTTGTHNVTIENCIFRNNLKSSGLNGAAVYRAFKVNITVTNSTFDNNDSDALFSYTSSGSFTVVNSIFQNHTGTYIYGSSSGTFSFDHCLFSDDPSANSAITTFTNNLINSDALLDSKDKPQAGSPAIDAGTNSGITAFLILQVTQGLLIQQLISDLLNIHRQQA